MSSMERMIYTASIRPTGRLPRPEKGANSLMSRGEKEPVQVVCPRCRHTEIVYLPVADLPLCPECKIQMLIEELLDEGKSY